MLRQISGPVRRHTLPHLSASPHRHQPLTAAALARVLPSPPHAQVRPPSPSQPGARSHSNRDSDSFVTRPSPSLISQASVTSSSSQAELSRCPRRAPRPSVSRSSGCARQPSSPCRLFTVRRADVEESGLELTMFRIFSQERLWQEAHGLADCKCHAAAARVWRRRLKRLFPPCSFSAFVQQF